MAVAGDSPVESPEDDSLGRSGQAALFATNLLEMDASRGLVVGVLGPWGSGKTSFVNLARRELDAVGVSVLDFNPWMFSGAEQLVDRFFAELASQLKLRPDLAEIGDQFEQYGEMFVGMGWLPFVGAWIERGRAVNKLLSKAVQRRREGTGTRRERLQVALAGLGRPLAVVLDDIDRLSSAEIREMFKLVRLTANFPNVIYVVAFDRVRVERALDDDGVPGRAYLEKILQLTVDLPAVPDQVLHRLILDAIQEAVVSIENEGPFEENRWPDTFTEVIRPLISTMRDVRRYAASVYGTVRALQGGVELGDALALEAVRVFLPDVYAEVAAAVNGLTTAYQWTGIGSTDPPELKSQVERVVAAAQGNERLARALITRLFPAAERHLGGSTYDASWESRWLRDRRVAHRDLLRLFLERTVSESLKTHLAAEHAFSLMDDADRFGEYLRSIDPAEVEDVIRALSNISDRFDAGLAVPALTVLLNLLPEMPNRKRGMFDLDARYSVGRMTYLLLSPLNDPEVAERIVRDVLPRLTTLWGKFELLTSVGHRENAGHRFVSEVVAAELEADWREQVRTTSPDVLLREKNLLVLLWRAKADAKPDEPVLVLDESPMVTVGLLRSAVSETRSQTIGSRAIHIAERLSWDMLVELVGGEDNLRARIELVRDTDDERLREIVTLCDRYFAGWRPE